MFLSQNLSNEWLGSTCGVYLPPHPQKKGGIIEVPSQSHGLGARLIQPGEQDADQTQKITFIHTAVAWCTGHKKKEQGKLLEINNDLISNFGCAHFGF